MDTSRAVSGRSVGASAGLAALMLIGLGLIFTSLRLQSGIWALPAFLPLYGWMAACAAAKRTLRPRRLARLHGWRRAAAIVAGIGVFLLVWPAWAHGAQMA